MTDDEPGLLDNQLEEIEQEVKLIREILIEDTASIRGHIEEALMAPPDEREIHLRKALQLLHRLDGGAVSRQQDDQPPK